MTARLMTDTEAESLWCPMSLVKDGTDPAYNRIKAVGGFQTPGECRCIASKCGMWTTSGHKEELDEAGEVHLITKGFCGLAHKPTEIK